MKLWVILPAFNESENISELLDKMDSFRATLSSGVQIETVVVDDGSSDGTAACVTAWGQSTHTAEHMPVTLLKHEVNCGLAAAMSTGLQYCAKNGADDDIIGAMDADNTHPPGLMHAMLHKAYAGFDVVIASRYQPGSRVVGLTPWRHLMSFGARLLFKAIYPIPGVRDYTCGYRLYRAGLIKSALAANPEFISEKGFTVMADILLKLSLVQPAPVFAEVPMLLRYDLKCGVSKMKVGRTVARSVYLLIRRRLGVAN